MIGGDLNARTGDEGDIGNQWKGIKEKRNSKDKQKNKERKKLLEWTQDRRWSILNGNREGDEDGEFTYLGNRGEASTIDYVMVNEEARYKIKRFEVAERTESDHQPIEVTMEQKFQREIIKKENGIRIVEEWNEEGRKQYRQNTENMRFLEKSMYGAVEELVRKIEEATKKKRIKNGMNIGKKKWWSKECREKKKEVRKALRNWRRGVGDKEIYRRQRADYNKLCKLKQQQEKTKEEQEIRNIKTEQEAWKYINKERTTRKEISKNIKIKEWEEYFVNLLQGTRAEREQTQDQQTREQEREREEITIEQIKGVIRRLGLKKAAGEDGIKNEAWIYG